MEQPNISPASALHLNEFTTQELQLLQAVLQRNTATARSLLVNGTPHKVTMRGGFGLLHVSISNNDMPTTLLLLELAPELIDARNDNLVTPLQRAAYQLLPDMVRVLLAHGADVNATSDNGMTALQAAASAKTTNDAVLALTIELLLGAGANLEAVDNLGNRAVHTPPAHSTRQRCGY